MAGGSALIDRAAPLRRGPAGDSDEHPVRIQRLCAHHAVEGFDCGRPELNRALRRIQQGFRTGVDNGWIWVAAKGVAVVGAVAATEVFVEPSGMTKPRQSAQIDRFAFFISYFAVSVTHQQGPLAQRLVRTIRSCAEVREASNPEARYELELALPFDDDEALRGFLGRVGFSPYGELGLYWARERSR